MSDTHLFPPAESMRTQSRPVPAARIVPSSRIAAVGLLCLPMLVGLILSGAACSTRSTTPTVGPDSTLVYSSRIPGDVQASITFSLRDSKRREEQRRLERERQRQIERERKEQEAKERAERAKARAEAKRKKAGTSTKSKKPAKKSPTASRAPAAKGATAKATTIVPVKTPDPDTASAIASTSPETLRVDSPPAGNAAKSSSLPAGERVFELEEGARVLASIRIENPYGRGKRPLLFHTVWLNPQGKRVFKKMIEWTPNDTSQVFTTSLTIPPSRRTAGQYELQVFLFRELIASKTIQLTGESTATQEKDDTGGM